MTLFTDIKFVVFFTGNFVCSILTRLLEKVQAQDNINTEVMNQTSGKASVFTEHVCVKTESLDESKNGMDDPVNEAVKEEKPDILDEIVDSFSKEDLKKLIVKSKNGDNVLFCDTGIILYDLHCD